MSNPSSGLASRQNVAFEPMNVVVSRVERYRERLVARTLSVAELRDVCTDLARLSEPAQLSRFSASHARIINNTRVLADRMAVNPNATYNCPNCTDQYA